MKVRLSGQAKRDLRGIAAYIARDNPPRAVSFVAELHAVVLQIGERPNAFPNREDLFPELRSALHRPYLILFRIHENEVQIGRVIHGARDLARHIKTGMFE
jgi:toxin ParE1/3/4